MMFQGAKKLAVNHLPLERGLDVQTWTSNRKPDGKALVTWLLDVRGSREMPKNLNLKVSSDAKVFRGRDHFKILIH